MAVPAAPDAHSPPVLTPAIERLLEEAYDDCVSNADGDTAKAASYAIEMLNLDPDLEDEIADLFFRWHMEAEFGAAFARDWFAGRIRW